MRMFAALPLLACMALPLFAQEEPPVVEEIDMPGYVLTNDTPHIEAYLELYPEAPDVVTDMGRLHLPTVAIAVKNDAAARLFFDHGANVNARSYGCVTPLMAACCTNDSPMIAYLLEKGAKIETNGNPCALSLACAYADVPVIEMLLANGASCAFPYGDISCATLCTRENLSDDATCALIQKMHENGLDLNALDEVGYPAYVRAARAGKLKTLKFMLENGAEVPAELQSAFLYECSRLTDSAPYVYLQSLKFEPDSFSYTPLDAVAPPTLERLLLLNDLNMLIEHKRKLKEFTRLENYKKSYPPGADATALISRALQSGDYDALAYALDSCTYTHYDNLFDIGFAKPNEKSVRFLFDRGLISFNDNSNISAIFRRGYYNLARYMLDNASFSQGYSAASLIKQGILEGNYQMAKCAYDYVSQNFPDDITTYALRGLTSNVNFLKYVLTSGSISLTDDPFLLQQSFGEESPNYDSLAYLEQEGYRVDPGMVMYSAVQFLSTPSSDDLFSLYIRLGGTLKVDQNANTGGAAIITRGGTVLHISTGANIQQQNNTITFAMGYNASGVELDEDHPKALNTINAPLLRMMDVNLTNFYAITRMIRNGGDVTALNPDGVSPQSLFLERKETLNPFTRYAYTPFF